MQERISFAWLIAAARLRKRCVDLVSKAGFTLQEIAVLGCLAENGPTNHNALANRVGIDKAALVPLARGLFGASLVEVDYEEPDRRGTQWSLMSDGRDSLADINARLDQLEGELFSSLSDEERQVLRKVVARLLRC